MNNDLISRKALKKDITEVFETEEKIDKKWALGLKYSLKIIDNAPTVDFPDWYKVYEDVKGTFERPQGEWVKDEEHSITINMFRCSNCNGGGYTHFKYCPHCGSRMEGENE